MSTLTEIFGWTNKVVKPSELPEIFPMPVAQGEFITTDVMTIYSKILTDVLERCHGLTDEQFNLMWDNCVKSSSSDGLISMLARAMTEKAELYLVYDKKGRIVRRADSEEQSRIREDYEKQAKSSVGVYITFKNYRRSDMVRLYSALNYSTISALNKSLNISAAPQLKISDLRASVSLADSADAKEQAVLICEGLVNGNSILLDAKDSIETATPDLSATEKSILFIGDKLAFYLGMPSSYITGEQTGGIGSTGENDMRAVERGLKAYYFSILKPTLESIFGAKVEYKSQDFRQIAGSMEVLKTFALIDEEFISLENKQKIVNKLLDLPEDATGDPMPKAQPVVVTQPKGIANATA